MRKFFAIVLAVAMVMSLAAVSFAAEDDINSVADVKLVGPYRYDADTNTMIDPTKDEFKASGKRGDSLRYGEGVYYLIMIEDADETLTGTGHAAISQYKEVEKLKMKAEFEMGESLVESVSIVKKYVDYTAQTKNSTYADVDFSIKADGGLTKSNYYYFVEFKVVNKETTSEADIIGTLEFDRKLDDDVKSTSNSADKGIGKIKDDEEDFEFTVFYKNTWVENIESEITNDRANLKWDTNYALKFNCDDEVELEFGCENDGNNEGKFLVDVSGQGKVFLRYNTNAVDAIADANPGVKMSFISFNNAKFNRVGEFTYEMDDIAAAYKIVDGKLVEIKGVEIDGDEAVFHTRVLESYVFADAELVNPVVEAPVVEAPAADAVTNPTTGAAA